MSEHSNRRSNAPESSTFPLCVMTHRKVDPKSEMWYTPNKGADYMDDFVIVKDRRNGVIPSMTAENQEYKLHWIYDGDYMADKAAGTLRKESLVVQITPKQAKNLDIIYVPIDEDAVIQVHAGSLMTSDVAALKSALDIAKEAAEKAVSFMRQYL